MTPKGFQKHQKDDTICTTLCLLFVLFLSYFSSLVLLFLNFKVLNFPFLIFLYHEMLNLQLLAFYVELHSIKKPLRSFYEVPILKREVLSNSENIGWVYGISYLNWPVFEAEKDFLIG